MRRKPPLTAGGALRVRAHPPGSSSRVNRRWEFPRDLSIGNVTFGDVRKFWSAVTVLASIHEMAHLIVAQGEATKRPRGSIVAVRSREEWGELIQDVAGIGAGAASELLWWYTFDPKCRSRVYRSSR